MTKSIRYDFYKPSDYDNCDHEWKKTGRENYSNELLTDMICIKCNCPGEKDEDLDEVYYPAT